MNEKLTPVEIVEIFNLDSYSDRPTLHEECKGGQVERNGSLYDIMFVQMDRLSYNQGYSYKWTLRREDS
ncbi:MAG: hypothetical protein U9P79_06755 [Candidatus Cloacimonadota bacterium]|nr:hypothetical protein [Candidatus Cloacimonadota bacterium]